MTKLSKTLAASALAVAFGFASVPAGAVGVFNEFTVDEGSVPGNAAGTITADLINGAYAERISFDGLGGFVTNAFANFSQFLENEGVDPVASQLGPAGSYSLYALFASTGTVAGGPLFTFTGADASFSLWIDPLQNTTKALGATGADPIVLGGTADDYMIASASDLSSGSGVLVAGVGGFFDLVFEDFTLTGDGDDYFISPSPFYFRTNVDGDFNNFLVTGTQTVTGDVSAVFIPEPGTLALVGLALLGLGFGMRRQA